MEKLCRLFFTFVFTHMALSVKSLALPVNTADTIIINLSQATLSQNFLDVPVALKSNVTVFSFDYAFRFNLSKLSYSSTTASSLAPNSMLSTSFFSPQDLFLRSTNSSQQTIPNNTTIHSIRFVLSAPCTSITASDFTDLLAIINGTQCIAKVTALDFNQFIPSPQYSSTPKCLNTPIIFTNTSTLTLGNFTQSVWTFDGQVNPSFPNAVQNYSSTSQHTLQLFLASSLGCTNTLTSTFTISTPPLASFTSTYFCQGDSVQFSNTSLSNLAPITSFYWHFFDGTSSTLPHPSHHFTSHKAHTIYLKITDASECSSTCKNLVFVLPTDFSQDGIIDVNDYLWFAPNYGMNCD
jgi:hypothetical protein